MSTQETETFEGTFTFINNETEAERTIKVKVTLNADVAFIDAVDTLQEMAADKLPKSWGTDYEITDDAVESIG